MHLISKQLDSLFKAKHHELRLGGGRQIELVPEAALSATGAAMRRTALHVAVAVISTNRANFPITHVALQIWSIPAIGCGIRVFLREPA